MDKEEIRRKSKAGIPLTEEEIKFIIGTREERERIADTFTYWESCIGCGASEKDYYIEHGWSMLVWHVEAGMVCENCYADYDDEDDDDEEDG